MDVIARLTKVARRCKNCLALALLLTAPAGAEPPALRDCVAAAAEPIAAVACEQREQQALKARIAALSAAIRTRLDPRQRPVFERSSAAWQAFVDREIAMLELSFGQRRDGLGPILQPSALTLLYEERERHLKAHLHNLGIARPAPPAASP